MSTPSKRLKLSYVINNLNVGGAEKLLLSIVKSLPKTKYHISVFSMFDGTELMPDFEATGVNVIHLGLRHKRDLSSLQTLYRHFKNDPPNIVHTHLLEADIFGRYAAWFAHVPVVISTEHTIEPWKMQPRRLKTRLRCWLDRIITKHSSGIIAVSNKVRDFLIDYHGMASENIFVIRNGIETHNDHLESGQINKDMTTFGSVGRLFEAKGYVYLLNAFKEVSDMEPNVKLVIAGDGPLQQNLEKLVSDFNLTSKVTFLGYVRDIKSFLDKIDIFVLSSIQEGVPLALLEAMAAQKPIIATKVGGVPEIIDHAQDGFLVEPANIQQLKRAMNTLLLEQDTRCRFAQNARRKVVNQFSIETMIHSLDNLYDMLLSRAHHRTGES